MKGLPIPIALARDVVGKWLSLCGLRISLKALDFAIPSSMRLIRSRLTLCYLSTFATEMTGSHSDLSVLL